MRKIRIIQKILTICFTTISVILTYETYDFFRITQGVPDGAGFSLYVLLGTWEVQDRIPISEVDKYVNDLCNVTIIFWIISLLMIFIWIRLRNVKDNK